MDIFNISKILVRRVIKAGRKLPNNSGRVTKLPFMVEKI